ncbi:MAG: 2-dehydro-3-deoxy-6-phosphogalactonate aldolase [Roseovarius sp.]
MQREIIAILRGVNPGECLAITDALIDAGITQIEVPLNSPDPFNSIARMVAHAGDRALIGAGTVLDTGEVTRLAEIGAGMVISPDTNPAVITATKAAGMRSYPGVFTATEAFAALRAGADGLKFYPAFKLGPDGFSALAAVLPRGTGCYAVGGINPSDFAVWRGVGITGFGLGTILYRPGSSANEIAAAARRAVAAWDAITR